MTTPQERAAIRARAEELGRSMPPPTAEQLAVLQRILGPALQRVIAEQPPQPRRPKKAS